MATKDPIRMPASNIAIVPETGALVETYQRMIDAMVKRINELEKRVTALGG